MCIFWHKIPYCDPSLSQAASLLLSVTNRESECRSSACLYHHSSTTVRRTASHYCHWGQLFKFYLCFILKHIWNTAQFKSFAATAELAEQEMFLIPKNLLPTCQGTRQAQPPKWYSMSLVTLWACKHYLLSLSDENLHVLWLTAESVEPTELWEMCFFFCLLLKSLQGKILPSFISISTHQGQRFRPLHSGNKKGRSKSKPPNWSLPYLSDRWIIHRPFTVSHASQHIPCGILCLRLQTVSSLSNYSWNQFFFRDPWSKMTVA